MNPDDAEAHASWTAEVRIDADQFEIGGRGASSLAEPQLSASTRSPQQISPAIAAEPSAEAVRLLGEEPELSLVTDRESD